MDSNRIRNFCLIGTIFFLLTGCSKSEYLDSLSTEFHPGNNVEQSLYKRPLDEAMENAIDFVHKFHEKSSSPSTRNNTSPTISRVHYVESNGIKTRGGEEMEIDTLLYAFDIEGGGFILSSSDYRTSPIYAYVEEGSFSEVSTEEENPGFALFVENAICKIQSDIDNYNSSSVKEGIFTKASPGDMDSDGYQVTYLQNPILQTKWGQLAPYNKWTPIQNGYHCPTGCVITASAQILSHFKTPGWVNWSTIDQYSHYHMSGSSAVNWNEILSLCQSGNRGGSLDSLDLNNTYAVQVAHLMRYLGVEMDANYALGGTGSTIDKARDWFRNNGFTVSSKQNIDAIKARQWIASGQLVFASGKAGYHHVGFIFRVPNSGHAWVLDGWLIAYKYNYSTNSTDSHDYVHCNWGWNGLRDGYFLVSAFDTAYKSEFPDDEWEEDYYSDANNYDYQLKMFSITR